MVLRNEVDAWQYYSTKRFRCPSCGAVSPVLADDVIIGGSDFLFNQCPTCEAFILIDNSDITLAREVVGFMAFSSMQEALTAVIELSETNGLTN